MSGSRVSRRLAGCPWVIVLSGEGGTVRFLPLRRCAVFITVIATVLAYGFNIAWMPFVARIDNYLNLFSSLLMFLELSVMQAIKAGMADENKWAVGVGRWNWWVLWAMGVWRVGGLVIMRA